MEQAVDEPTVRNLGPGDEADGRAGGASWILDQTEDVPVGVGHSGDQAATTDLPGGLVDAGARRGDLGQLRLDVRHVPIGHWRGHPLGTTPGYQSDVLAGGLKTDVVRVVGLRGHPQQGGIDGLGPRQADTGCRTDLMPCVEESVMVAPGVVAPIMVPIVR